MLLDARGAILLVVAGATIVSAQSAGQETIDTKSPEQQRIDELYERARSNYGNFSALGSFDAELSGGGAGPEMVIIPAGSFVLGEPARQAGDGIPASTEERLINIETNYAISRFEITVAQYRAFIDSTGHTTNARNCKTIGADEAQFPRLTWVDDATWRQPGFPQQDTHPVVCVTRDDAQHYVDWLAAESGMPYRLPSSAEWEYVASGGHTGTFFFPARYEASCQYGNTYDADSVANELSGPRFVNCSDGFQYTAPVGSYEPNSFGVYDTFGNVREWVADCYTAFPGVFSPENGEPYTEPGCTLWETRGGSYAEHPYYARNAARDVSAGNAAEGTLGFRVALSMPD